MKIAIDGPAGSGKSTVAREIAKRLGIVYIDSGAIYRGCAFIATKLGISLADESEVALCLPGNLNIDARPGSFRVLMKSDDITDSLRSPEVASMVSKVAPLAEVRKFVTEFIQDKFRSMDCCTDGRDIGTVVFPDAELKVFLTASAEERAGRRVNEHSLRGEKVNFDEILHEIKVRDEKDMTRAIAPLKKANDAIELDTTAMPLDKVISVVEGMAREKSAQGQVR